MTHHATPAELSLSQAAKETGKSKSTINRAIKNGKLSATRHEDGTYSIAASELFRAFPSGTATSSAWVETQPARTPTGTGEDTAAVRISALEDALQRERALNEDLKADRDHWRQQATALLAAPPRKNTRWRWWPWKE